MNDESRHHRGGRDDDKCETQASPDGPAWYLLGRDLVHIGRQLMQANSTLETIMTTLSDVQAKLAATEAKVDALTDAINTDQATDAAAMAALVEAKALADAEVVRLQGIIDAGGSVTPADMDALVTSLGAIGDKIDSASADVGGPNS